jgi:hypothetical protein
VATRVATVVVDQVVQRILKGVDTNAYTSICIDIYITMVQFRILSKCDDNQNSLAKSHLSFTHFLILCICRTHCATLGIVIRSRASSSNVCPSPAGRKTFIPQVRRRCNKFFSMDFALIFFTLLFSKMGIHFRRKLPRLSESKIYI